MPVVGVMEKGISKMEASHTRGETTAEFVLLRGLRTKSSGFDHLWMFDETDEKNVMRMSIEIMHPHVWRPIPVMIAWSHGGRQVSVTGSWDNWALTEPMHRSGEEFILVKLLPSGLYHYRFIVDGNLMYDRDGPLSFDDPGGNAYNILDVKEFTAESCENVPESTLPDSPEESYGRNSVHDVDFSKPPPDLPPQMYRPLLNESPLSWTNVHQLNARPQHVVLNHLYMKSCDGQVVALGSTQRFLEKYVTVILYKPYIRQS